MKKIITILICILSLSSFAQPRNMKVICFNIRYDNKDDGEFAWNNRKDAVVKMIETQKPQIIGMQEVLHNQLTFLTKNLKNYSAIGVGRDDGKTKGEYAPLLYDKKQLKVVKTGYFWLSETPNTPSKGWDAACERIATWAVFENKTDKKQFICINTHFDHIGQTARKNSGTQMLDSIKVLASTLPAIIMGDFNATIDDPSLAPIMSKTQNVRSIQKRFAQQQPAYTFIGFTPGTKKQLIDHIFIKGFKAKDYQIIQDTYGVKQLSDHLPVMCILEL